MMATQGSTMMSMAAGGMVSVEVGKRYGEYVWFDGC